MRAYVETDRGKYVDINDVLYADPRPANIIEHPTHKQGSWVINIFFDGNILHRYQRTLEGDYETEAQAFAVIKTMFKTLEMYFEEE
jgi:hypothetical protein